MHTYLFYRKWSLEHGLVYDRVTKQTYEDVHYGKKYLQFLYHHAVGRCLLKIAVRPSFSKLCGKYYDSPRSVKKIQPFIDKNKIDMSLFEDKHYNTFNEFFTRQKKNIHFDMKNEVLCSPCDSKLSCYTISKDLKLVIKNNVYTLKELLKDEQIVEEFQGGNCLVFRLAVNDYHRYCAVDDLEVLQSKKIKGKLHTVSSISKDYRIYAENERVVNTIQTKNLGKMIMIEVGAMLVGKITNSTKTKFHRGDEMGYFEYGGSTVILITQKGISLDDDILRNSKNHIETKVSVGEKIGKL